MIVNALCGREVYPVCERNVFQTFGPPPGAATAAAADAAGSGIRAA